MVVAVAKYIVSRYGWLRAESGWYRQVSGLYDCYQDMSSVCRVERQSAIELVKRKLLNGMKRKTTEESMGIFIFLEVSQEAPPMTAESGWTPFHMQTTPCLRNIISRSAR